MCVRSWIFTDRRVFASKGEGQETRKRLLDIITNSSNFNIDKNDNHDHQQQTPNNNIRKV